MKPSVFVALVLALLIVLPGCTSAATDTATPAPIATAAPPATKTATSIPTPSTYSGPVTLLYFGQSCILITAPDGTRIVSDPYGTYDHATGLDPLPEDLSADAVTVSHSHPDHNATYAVGGTPQILRAPGLYQIGMVKVTGYKGYEGSPDGPSTMPNTIFVFEIAGVKIVQLGDSGPVTLAEVLAGIENADVMLVNVDNYVFARKEIMPFMQGIHARTVIPTHYGITPSGSSMYRDKFVESLSPDVVVVNGESEIQVTPGMPVQVAVLAPRMHTK